MRVLASSIVVLVGAFASDASAEKMHTFRPGMVIGGGIDGVTGELRGACIDHPPATRSQGGQQVHMSIDQIESSKELRSKLRLEAEASYAGLGSGRLTFQEQSEFNRFAKYVVASVRVENSQTILDVSQTRLNASARALLESGDLDRFTERCGTAFFYTMNTGGEFFALYRIVTTSQSEEKELETELKGGLGVISASGAFHSKIEALAKTGSVDIDVFRDGDMGATEPDTPEEIINYALNFSKVITDPAKARNFSVVSTPYTVLDLPDLKVAMIDASRYNDELSAITLRSDVYSDDISDLSFVIKNPDQFEGVDAAKKEEIFAAVNALQAGQRALKDRANACLERKDPECFTPGAGEAVSVAVETVLPERKRVDPVLADAKNACEGVSGSGRAKVVRLKKLEDHLELVVWIPNSKWKISYVGTDEGGLPFHWTRPRSEWRDQLREESVDVTENCMVLRDQDVAEMTRKCYVFSDRRLKRPLEGEVACLDWMK